MRVSDLGPGGSQITKSLKTSRKSRKFVLQQLTLDRCHLHGGLQATPLCGAPPGPLGARVRGPPLAGPRRCLTRRSPRPRCGPTMRGTPRGAARVPRASPLEGPQRNYPTDFQDFLVVVQVQMDLPGSRPWRLSYRSSDLARRAPPGKKQ